jgi:hypothetical protein
VTDGVGRRRGWDVGEHRLVRRGVPSLRAALEESGGSLPQFVWREFERYLSCGDAEKGFAPDVAGRLGDSGDVW